MNTIIQENKKEIAEELAENSVYSKSFFMRLPKDILYMFYNGMLEAGPYKRIVLSNAIMIYCYGLKRMVTNEK